MATLDRHINYLLPIYETLLPRELPHAVLACGSCLSRIEGVSIRAAHMPLKVKPIHQKVSVFK